MPDTLRTVIFTNEMLPAVQHFDMGVQPWESEVAEWIKGRPPGDSVVEAMARNPVPTRVWLYLNKDDAIIGYASLGETTWRWPTKKDPKTAVGIVPMLGVHNAFKGQPIGLGETKYSRQILSHITAQAKKSGYELLGLFVHKDNTKARTLYLSDGFKEFPPPYENNVRMVKPLTAVTVIPPPSAQIAQ